METGKNRKVFGVYQSEVEAQNAVEDLLRMGYTSEEISVVSRSKDRVDGETALEEGMKTGAAAGAAAGGLGGLMAGLGLLVIPGIGPILAAGPIAAALGGAIAGGALGAGIGTLGGALEDSGADAEDIKYINDRFAAGDIIVYVDERENNYETVADRLGYRSWNHADAITDNHDPEVARPLTDTEYDGITRDFNQTAGSVPPYPNLNTAVTPPAETFDDTPVRDPFNNDLYASADSRDPIYDVRRNDDMNKLNDELNKVENKIQDTATDLKHDAEKAAEKTERHIENAGEPLENAQNWVGDKVSDVKHEAGKIIDKAKNRLDD